MCGWTDWINVVQDNESIYRPLPSLAGEELFSVWLIVWLIKERSWNATCYCAEDQTVSLPHEWGNRWTVRKQDEFPSLAVWSGQLQRLQKVSRCNLPSPSVIGRLFTMEFYSGWGGCATHWWYCLEQYLCCSALTSSPKKSSHSSVVDPTRYWVCCHRSQSLGLHTASHPLHCSGYLHH